MRCVLYIVFGGTLVRCVLYSVFGGTLVRCVLYSVCVWRDSGEVCAVQCVCLEGLW